MITVLSPIIRQKKGAYEQLFKNLNQDGYLRVRVNKAIYRTDEKIPLERYKKHDIEIVIDRLQISDKSRLVKIFPISVNSLITIVLPSGEISGM